MALKRKKTEGYDGQGICRNPMSHTGYRCWQQRAKHGHAHNAGDHGNEKNTGGINKRTQHDAIFSTKGHAEAWLDIVARWARPIDEFDR